MKFKRKKGKDYNPYEQRTFLKVRKFKEQLQKLFDKMPPLENEKRLYKQLIGRQNQILLFLEDKDIEPTNNASERALRNRVTKRKVSGCFRSELGAFCNDKIASVIETAKKQGVNIVGKVYYVRAAFVNNV